MVLAVSYIIVAQRVLLPQSTVGGISITRLHSEVLVHAIRPQVGIIHNGTRKGGTAGSDDDTQRVTWS